MVDSISIRNKYDEFNASYANCHIDDFDTFVRAKVADYYINQVYASTDTIYVEIEKALCEANIEDTKNDDNNGYGIAENIEKNGNQFNTCSSLADNRMDSTLPKTAKAIPYIIGISAIFVGAIAWLVKHKSSNMF